MAFLNDKRRYKTKHIAACRDQDQTVFQRFCGYFAYLFRAHDTLDQTDASVRCQTVVFCHQLLQLLRQIRSHFLHMVLLTYHRTRLLPKDVPYAVFLCQRQLQSTYFSGVSAPKSYASLAESLEKGRFRNYLWLCETLWLKNRMGG